MKRKFKLLTSVASLCLAVALMAFGVYAAATPKVTITGTVTFQAENVFATVTVYKYVGTSETVADWGSPVKTITFNNTNNTDDSVNLGALALNDTNLYAGYKIVVSNGFTNKTEDKVYVKYTATGVTGLPEGVDATQGAPTGEVTTADWEYTCIYQVDPAAAGATFEAINIGGVLQVSRAAIPAA